jgi:hypothetical protein
MRILTLVACHSVKKDLCNDRMPEVASNEVRPSSPNFIIRSTLRGFSHAPRVRARPLTGNFALSRVGSLDCWRTLLMAAVHSDPRNDPAVVAACATSKATEERSDVDRRRQRVAMATKRRVLQSRQCDQSTRCTARQRRRRQQQQRRRRRTHSATHRIEPVSPAHRPFALTPPTAVYILTGYGRVKSECNAIS